MCVEEMAFCHCLIFLCLHREHTIQVPTLIHTYLLHAFRRCLILLFLDHEHASGLVLVPLQQRTSVWGEISVGISVEGVEMSEECGRTGLPLSHCSGARLHGGLTSVE